ncbi:hypothetical protein J3R83DRAFT_12807 [Lanmaoa asiatica]|nr:hypothetical protein J3R83DRAFT_12807 [Lanmaoa asiatica]
MPRRRPSQKAKFHSKPRPVDRKDSQIKRWNTLADIELDEEDQFHTSRDKILLDEGDEVDEDGDEEEVFALQGVSSDSSDDDDQGSDGMQVDSDTDTEPTAFESKSKPKPSKAARDTKKSSSKKSASDSEEEETWGHSKGAYYSSNAAQLDSEDEEANELEEQEALRLQAKARETMRDEDFGLGDVVEGDVEPPEAMEQDELANLLKTKVPQDKQSILRTLEKESPETLALARDWEDTVYSLVEVKSRVDASKNTESEALELGLLHMYYQALLTYATTLAFYLHLRATEKYAARPELLRRHPILKRLLTLKEGINTLESLGVGQDVPDDDDDGEDEEDDLTDEDEEDDDLWSLIKKKGLELGELADLLEDAAVSTPSPSPPPPSSKKPTPTKEEYADKRPKKKRKTAAAIHDPDPGTRGPVFDLLEPEYTRVSRKNRMVPVVDTVAAADPYGEVTALQCHDLSDKQARKKSLRFYVSRIESASSRRTNARANAISGDDDIPYRERKKEREARLEKEKEKKREKGQLGTGGDDLDNVDPEVSREEKKRKRKRGLDDEDLDDDVGGANGYYDLVKQVTATKKARKKAEYEVATARPGLESESTTGPRSVTRAILKNRGLTPHRSKAVRNPRVKKRQKYEQAKKKVASQKAVYKGGIGDVARYSGEQSGISKVVKSVRL